MPKKTTTARGGTQRNRSKAKVQKSFELVRQSSDEQGQAQEQELEMVNDAEPAAISVSTLTVPEVKRGKSRVSGEAKQDERADKTNAANEAKQGESASTETTTAPKGSAAARLAARRQGVQKAQQKAAAALITAEHYAYVRRDLVFIAILAAIMFSVIIILHFVPGIGS